MKKIRKISTGISWYFEFCRLSCGLGAIMALLNLGMIWLYYWAENTSIFGSWSLTLGTTLFEFADQFVPAVGDSVTLNTLEHLGLLASSVIGYFMHDSICNILEPMSKEQPFHHEVVANTKRLAWLTVISGVSKLVFEIIEHFLVKRVYDIQALFASENILGVKTALVLDFDFILYAVFLFLLSWTFRHGEELQQLSDETL